MQKLFYGPNRQTHPKTDQQTNILDYKTYFAEA